MPEKLVRHSRSYGGILTATETDKSVAGYLQLLACCRNTLRQYSVPEQCRRIVFEDKLAEHSRAMGRNLSARVTSKSF